MNRFICIFPYYTYIREGCHKRAYGKINRKNKNVPESLPCFVLSSSSFSCNFIHSSIFCMISSSEHHVIIKEKRLSVCFWILKVFFFKKMKPYKDRRCMLSIYPLKLWIVLEFSRCILLTIKDKLKKRCYKAVINGLSSLNMKLLANSRFLRL